MEKILVVDDEKSLREVMSIMLKRAGYEVTEASDGEQAIGQVNKEIYDLVITDLRMPRADGMDVLKAVKSSSPETVVLVVTMVTMAPTLKAPLRLLKADTAATVSGMLLMPVDRWWSTAMPLASSRQCSTC